MAEDLLKGLTDALKKNREGCPLDFIKDEYDALICFAEKNAELIHCKNDPPQRGPSVSATLETHWAHQTEVDRLQALKGNVPREAFLADLDASYKEGRISLAELNAIWNKTHNP